MDMERSKLTPRLFEKAEQLLMKLFSLLDELLFLCFASKDRDREREQSSVSTLGAWISLKV
jgi:hypothetical protein